MGHAGPDGPGPNRDTTTPSYHISSLCHVSVALAEATQQAMLLVGMSSCRTLAAAMTIECFSGNY